MTHTLPNVQVFDQIWQILWSSHRLIWKTKIKQTDLIFFILNNISCSTTFFGYWTTFFHPFVKTLSEIPFKELFVGRNSVFCWWTDILTKTGFRQNAKSLITPFYRIFFGKNNALVQNVGNWEMGARIHILSWKLIIL